MYIVKRNGLKEEANPQKIKNAIKAAFNSVDYKVEEDVFDKIVSEIPLWDGITIDEIQEEVVEILRDFDYDIVADAYYTYKVKRDASRKGVDDTIKYLLNYINSNDNASTLSNTDPNANVIIKNVANANGEVPKAQNRQVQRTWMKWALNKWYPGYAKQYIDDLEHHIIYTHDEASFPSPMNYCEAVTLYPLVQNGTSTMDGTSTKKPEHLSTFIGQLNNLLFLLSAQCKGAVAFGEFFNYFAYFAAKDYGPLFYEKGDLLADSEYVVNPKTIKDKIHQAFQQAVYYWNQPAGNRSYQSPFSNVSYYDENYWHALFDDFYFPDGTQVTWEQVDWVQREFMEWFNNERSKSLLTFPVETMCLLSDGNDIIDKKYKDFTAHMYAKGHSFFTYISDNPNALASCCRLRNEIQENVFSFTNGLSCVETGSCNVITLNLARITQDYSRSTNYKHGDKIPEGFFEGFKEYLTTIVKRVHIYHKAFKHLLYMFEKAGVYTASTAGYIHMSKLYSTVGMNGFNEAAMFLGMQVSYNEDYKKFCQLITGTISALNKEDGEKGYAFNSEFVPAEGLGSKNFNWDKKDGYWIPNDGRVLYNSYFYDAHDSNTTVLDRFKMHGREFTSLLDGGVGLHCNLQDHLTYKQYLKLIDLAIKEGTSYFTFNIPNTQCDDCGFISKHRLKECPKCGSKHLTWWTRVIGYLRPTKAFDSNRQIEESQRIYS